MNNPDIFHFRSTEVMRKFAALVFLLWLSAIVLRAGTHYVSLDGTNDVDNGYITWVGAATQIQWAASVATNGETVLVSNGTYNLTNQIEIRSNITIRSFTEQGHGTNDTIVNGNNYEGKLVTNRCFFMTNGVLDGLTISNGYAGPSTNGIGGGVYIINANASVYNCLIYRNYCSNDATVAYGGGGIYMTAGTITNCIILSNTVYEGAGVAAYGYAGGVYMNGSSAKIIASYIAVNKAYNVGGIYGSGTITNCTIASNLATNTGGVSGGQIRNCVISNNATSGTGYETGNNGGVFVGSGSTMYDSIIISNKASQYFGGGSVYGGGIISNCQVIGNRSGWIAGGIKVDAYWGASVLANCVFRENISGNGDAAIVQQDGTVRNCLVVSNSGVGINSGWYNPNRVYTSLLENCTVIFNSAGGLNLTGATNVIRNCIAYSNTSYDIQVGATAGSNNCWNICAPPSGIARLPVNHGNITNNPMFVDWVHGNYRLDVNSPCINAGINQSWMTNSYDLDRQPRIRYGTVDMGPYELIRSGTTYGFH